MAAQRTSPMVFRALRIAGIALVAASVIAVGGCGGSTDTPASTSTRAAATACPPSDGQAWNDAALTFTNLSSMDVVYSASAPDCAKWWGTGYPANYNGTEIPAMQAGDPPVSMALRPNGKVTETDMTDVRTVITFTRMDGSALGSIVASLHWDPPIMRIAPHNDGVSGEPSPNSTVVFSPPGGGKKVAIAIGGTQTVRNGYAFPFTIRDYGNG